jgi:hypothetical protein
MNFESGELRSDPINLFNGEATKKILVDSVLGRWEVMNHLPAAIQKGTLFIFDLAEAKTGSLAYDETKRVAQELAEMGCDIITGGGPRADAGGQ